MWQPGPALEQEEHTESGASTLTSGMMCCVRRLSRRKHRCTQDCTRPAEVELGNKTWREGLRLHEKGRLRGWTDKLKA